MDEVLIVLCGLAFESNGSVIRGHNGDFRVGLPKECHCTHDGGIDLRKSASTESLALIQSVWFMARQHNIPSPPARATLYSNDGSRPNERPVHQILWRSSSLVKSVMRLERAMVVKVNYNKTLWSTTWESKVDGGIDCVLGLTMMTTSCNDLDS